MDIPGFSNYTITRDGIITNKKTGNILKTQTQGDAPYKKIRLKKDDGTYFFASLHRLLALTFIDNPENHTEVDHINRDKRDNRIENLRWVSRSNNNYNMTRGELHHISFDNRLKNYTVRFTFKELEDAKEIRDIICNFIENKYNTTPY